MTGPGIQTTYRCNVPLRFLVQYESTHGTGNPHTRYSKGEAINGFPGCGIL